MLPREERYIQEWETKRSKGKWAYVLLTTFIWGSMLSVIVKAFGLAFKGLLSFESLSETVCSADFFPFWLRFVIGFFVFALVMWHLAQKKYRELKQKQEQGNKMQVPQ